MRVSEERLQPAKAKQGLCVSGALTLGMLVAAQKTGGDMQQAVVLVQDEKLPVVGPLLLLPCCRDL